MTLRGLPLLLKNHLRERRGTWVAKNDLTALRLPTSKGGTYGADLIGRKLRNLEEDAYIAVQYHHGHAHYRYIPDFLRTEYIPVSTRTNENQLWKDPTKAKGLLVAYKQA